MHFETGIGMYASYIRSVWRNSTSSISWTLTRLAVATVGMTTLQLFGSGYINGLPFAYVRNYLFLGLLMTFVSGLLMALQLQQNNSMELFIRKVHGADIINIFKLRLVASLLYTLAGTMLSYVFIDVFRQLLAIPGYLLSDFGLGQIPGILVTCLVIPMVAILTAFITFLVEAQEIN